MPVILQALKHCENEGACIRTLSAAHSAEMFALGWQ